MQKIIIWCCVTAILLNCVKYCSEKRRNICLMLRFCLQNCHMSLFRQLITPKLIRDAKDQPILNAAIVYGVDIILTGDKDFLSLKLESPQCMNVAEFLSEY